jgi:hypothetical protein
VTGRGIFAERSLIAAGVEIDRVCGQIPFIMRAE